jgi:hypothetical protein
MNESDTATIIKWGVIGAGGYLLYQFLSGLAKNPLPISNPLAPLGNAIGGDLFDLFNPGAAGASATYIATLPNGTNAAINNTAVNADGTTVYNGTTYQMMVNPNITSGVNKTLVPVDNSDLIASDSGMDY